MRRFRRALPVLVLALGCAGWPVRGGREVPDAERPEATPDAPELRPRVDASEQAALLEGARRDIARAEELLDGLDPSGLGDDERQRLTMTRELLEEARRALEAREPHRAASLAEKASILAADLAGP